MPRKKAEPPAVVVAHEPEPEKMFPVRLTKNYRPAGDFTIFEREDPDDPVSPMQERKPLGKPEKLDDDGRVVKPATEERAKVWSGTVISLPIGEARTLLESRLAERADAIR